MQCKDIHLKLRAGELPSGPGAQLHLSACEACQLLAEEHAFLATQLAILDEQPMQPVGDELFAALQLQINETKPSKRGRLQELPTWAQYSILGLFSALLIGFVYLFKARADLATYPWLRMLSSMVGMTLLLGVGVWATQRPLYRPPLSQTWLRSLWGLSLLVPLVFALWPEAHTSHTASAGAMGFWPHTLACFGYGVGNALPLLFLARLISHGDRPRSGVITLALSGGLLGNIALQLHCAVVHPLHLALSHASVGAFLVLGYFGISAWQDRRATA